MIALTYLEYVDLSDALLCGIHSAREFCSSSPTEEGRKCWTEKEARYQELMAKLKHYAIDDRLD